MKPKSFKKFWHKITFNQFNKNHDTKNIFISEQKKHTYDLITKICVLELTVIACG